MKSSNYRKLILLGIMPIFFSLASCQSIKEAFPSNNQQTTYIKGSNNYTKLNPAKKSQFLLGTIITASAYGNNAEQALELAFNKVSEIDSKMSRYRSGSEIDLINQNAGIKDIKISPDTFYLIEKSIDYCIKTQGAFQPLIGEIVDLWDIGGDNERVPANNEINKYLAAIDINHIRLNKENYTAGLTSNKVKLDLGAIAKGYAADVMRDTLIDKGIESALLNLGGNIIVIGPKPDGNPWSIGIQDPFKSERGNAAAIIKSRDTSVVTSGNYERFFETQDKIYHHIFDPDTGFPAENGIVSSTIITPNSTDADALSTSVYIMGKDKGLKLIESIPNTEAIIITKDKKIYTSSGITQELLDIRNGDLVYEKSR